MIYLPPADMVFFLAPVFWDLAVASATAGFRLDSAAVAAAFFAAAAGFEVVLEVVFASGFFFLVAGLPV